MATIDTLKKMQQDLNEKIQSEGKKALADTFAEFFDANPEIKAVAWTQYTPHFNDGEACTFNVHDFSYATTLEGVAEASSSYDEPFKETYGEKSSASEAVRKLNRYLDEVEDIMEHAFGDHAFVVATRDGFRVDEYEHD